MKILSISIENYKALRVFEHYLGGKNLAIAGPTGEGKTTAISALWDIIEKVGDPVSHGEKKGHIKVVLGDGDKTVTAERRFTTKTSQVIVMTGAGKKVSVQDFKQWYNKLGVNPHRIMDMRPLERTKTLLQAVELPEGVDLEDLDKRRDDFAQKRTEAKVILDAAEKRVGPEPDSVQTIDVAELIRQRDRILSHNGAIVKREHDIAQMALEIDKVRGDIAALESKLEERRKDLTTAENLHAGMFEELQGMEKQSTDEVDEELDRVGEVNKKAEEHRQWEERSHEYDEAVERFAELDGKVKAVDQEKKDAVAAAKWPLPGLSIQDGDVIYNGNLLTNCGSSEQMLVCGALAASTFKDGELRVVRIDGAESMSKADFQALEQVFEEKGVQVLSARVSRGDVEENEITIEQGADITSEDW